MEYIKEAKIPDWQKCSKDSTYYLHFKNKLYIEEIANQAKLAANYDKDMMSQVKNAIIKPT